VTLLFSLKSSSSSDMLTSTPAPHCSTGIYWCATGCLLVVLQVAAAGTRELWLAWIDALIAFEGSLGRSGLLGCYWEVADARDLPVLLLRGSTLSVFGEDPAWLVSDTEQRETTVYCIKMNSSSTLSLLGEDPAWLVSSAAACGPTWHTALDALYTYGYRRHVYCSCGYFWRAAGAVLACLAAIGRCCCCAAAHSACLGRTPLGW
jgi:hypothetical protein